MTAPRKSFLVLFIALLGLAVAAPSMALAGAADHSRSAHAAKKKCKKKKRAPVPLPAPAPTPLPLTVGEVRDRMLLKAALYCDEDISCVAWGFYKVGESADNLSCLSQTTYSWTCYGYNDEETAGGAPPDATCDFREVVEREGIGGVTSHQDLTFGSGGWACGPYNGPDDP